MTSSPTAAVLVIGNEILSGRTKDRNVAHIADRLVVIGIRLQEVRIVPDVRHRIIGAVRELRSTYDHVITTGGIGPTHDDITTECVAEALGVEVERNAEAVRRLEAHYQGTAIELNEARLRMANIPRGATLIDNPVSAAPGFRIENLSVLAGVPQIMRAMLAMLEPELGTGPVIHGTTFVVSRPEGSLAEGLGQIARRHPDVDIGSYPYYRPPDIGTSLVLRSTDLAALHACADVLRAFLDQVGAPHREDR